MRVHACKVGAARGEGGAQQRAGRVTHLSASVMLRGPADTSTLPQIAVMASGAPFTKYHSEADGGAPAHTAAGNTTQVDARAVATISTCVRPSHR
jgi:hypothetical protein